MFGPQNNNHKVSHVTAQILLLAAAAEEEQGNDEQVWNGFGMVLHRVTKLT